MKRAISILAISALSLTLPAQSKPVPKLSPKTDDKAKLEAVEKAIAGEWQGVSAVALGGKGGFSDLWRFGDGKIVRVSKKSTGESKYRIISPGPPAQIDVTPGTGIGANKILKEIIKVESDILTICHVAGRNENPEQLNRPTKFGITAEEEYMTFTFRRVVAGK